MKRIGYKIMPIIDGQLSSGADKRQSDFKLEKNSNMYMPGNGIYITPHRDYALDYYSGLAENEVLLTLEYDDNHIITGNLDDKEPEISVNNATIKSIEFLKDGELKPVKKKRRPRP